MLITPYHTKTEIAQDAHKHNQKKKKKEKNTTDKHYFMRVKVFLGSPFLMANV